MEVICPGYGRTGTRSTQKALEILGFGPSYHMYEIVFKHTSTHPQLWVDGYKGRGLKVREIFEGYKSVTDWPASDFYEDILREYPDAKVVLTLRDPDAWWGSIIRSVHARALHPAWVDWGRFFLIMLIPNFRGLIYMLRHIPVLQMSEGEAKDAYLRHIARIKTVVPAEQLLEFSVKEGWDPLCSFLGVPVPAEPFPRTNSREEMENLLASRSRFGWVLMLATVTTAGLSVWATTSLVGSGSGAALAAVEICLFTASAVEAGKINRSQVGRA